MDGSGGRRCGLGLPQHQAEIDFQHGTGFFQTQTGMRSHVFPTAPGRHERQTFSDCRPLALRQATEFPDKDQIDPLAQGFSPALQRTIQYGRKRLMQTRGFSHGRNGLVQIDELIQIGLQSLLEGTFRTDEVEIAKDPVSQTTRRNAEEGLQIFKVLEDRVLADSWSILACR